MEAGVGRDVEGAHDGDESLAGHGPQFGQPARSQPEGRGVDARAGSTDALQKLLVAEIAKWGAVIERAKIEKQ